jgi:hypothetical protein
VHSSSGFVGNFGGLKGAFRVGDALGRGRGSCSWCLPQPHARLIAILGDELDAARSSGTAAVADAFDSTTHEDGSDVGAE